jgi:hypothetical protein
MAARKKVSNVDKVAERIGDEPKLDTSDSAFAAISRLAVLQHRAELNVAKIEDDLKAAKEVLRVISEEDLPMAMMAVGIKKFETDDLIVERASAYQASIAVINRPSAYAWLVANEYGGLLKLNVDVHFGRGEKDKAEKLAEQLRKKGIEVDVEQTIHAQTLKAFVQERMTDTESKVVFPAELFGARAYNIAKVKPKKK